LFHFWGQILHNKFDATFKTFTPFSRVRDHAWQTQSLAGENPRTNPKSPTPKTHRMYVFLGDSLYGCGGSLIAAKRVIIRASFLAASANEITNASHVLIKFRLHRFGCTTFVSAPNTWMFPEFYAF